MDSTVEKKNAFPDLRQLVLHADPVRHLLLQFNPLSDFELQTTLVEVCRDYITSKQFLNRFCGIVQHSLDANRICNTLFA